MKKLLLTLVGVLMALPSLAVDFFYTYEGYKLGYNILSETDKTVSLSSDQEYYDWNEWRALSGHLILPEKVIFNDEEYTLTTIEGSAFQYINELRSIIIPPSVRSCPKNPYISTDVKKAAYPSTISNPFDHEYWRFENAIQYSADGAQIENGHVYGNDKSILYYTPLNLSGEYIVPSTVKKIGEKAFYGCDDISSIIIPASVTSAEKIFDGNNKISEAIILSHNVLSIPFNNNLKKALVPEGFNYTPTENQVLCIFNEDIEYVDGYVYAADKLVYARLSKSGNVEIPASINTISSNAFALCNVDVFSFAPSDTPINIEKNALNSPHLLYFNREWNNNDYPLSANCSQVVFSENITTIPAYSFYQNESLRELNLPGSLNFIGANAFADCSNISAITVLALKAPSLEDLSVFKGLYETAQVNILPEAIQSYGAPGSKWYYFKSIQDYVGINSEPDFVDNLNFAYRKVDDANVEIVRSEEYSALSEVSIPSSITIEETIGEGDDAETVETTYNVIGIGAKAFAGFDNITYLHIADGVEYIGSEAFANCQSLSIIKLPEGIKRIGNKAFNGCNTDADIELGNSLEIIGNEAFIGMKNITSLNFEETLREVGIKAFAGCTGLTSVAFSSEVSMIGDNAFEGCSSLASVSFNEGKGALIGSNAFMGCTKLTEVSIGDGYLSIGSGAFAGTTAMTSVVIGKGVKNIGDFAFMNSRLRTLQFADDCTLTRIGNGAFDNAIAITGELNIPSNVEYIGNSAFRSVRAITKVCFPENEKLCIGDSAFYSCQRLAAIEFPSAITSVGSYAFANNDQLTGLQMTATKSVGEYAFSQCSRIKSVDLTTNNLSEYVFNECLSIETLSLTGNMTLTKSAINGCAGIISARLDIPYIGDEAMSHCASLQSVDLSGRTKYIGSGAFRDLKTLTQANFGLNLVEVGNRAFSNTGLTKVVFPSGVEPESVITLQENAFYNLPIKELSLGNRMKSVKGGNFIADRNWAGSYSMFLDVCNLGNTVSEIVDACPIAPEIIIPGSITQIKFGFDDFHADYAFDDDGIGTGYRYPEKYTVKKMVFEESQRTLNIQDIGFGGELRVDSLIVKRNWMACEEWSSSDVKADGISMWVNNLIFPDNLSNGIYIYYPLVKSHQNWGDSRRINDSECSVYIGNSVKSIDFSNYLPFTASSITFADGVETIHSSALNRMECAALRFPKSLKNIPGNGFDFSSKTKSVVFADGEDVLNVSANAFYGDNTALEEIYFGRNITSDNDQFNFSKFKALKKVILGNDEAATVTYIPANMFYHCESLEQTIMSDKIRSIGASAFDGCSNLKTAIFPANLSEIGDFAYRNCESIERIVARTMVPVEGSVGFSQTVEDNVPLYVPDEAIKDYEASDLFFFFYLNNNLFGMKNNIVDAVTAENTDQLYDVEAGEQIDLNEVLNPQYVYNSEDTQSNTRRRVAANDSEQKFYWFSPNPDAATISADGIMTIHKAEPAEVWCYALDGSDKKAVIGLNRFILGDVNSDMKVDAADVNAIIGHLVNSEDNVIRFDASDMNGDGKIDSADVNMLINQIVNKEI